MNPKKVFSIKSTVSKIKSTKEGVLIVVDEENTVRKIDLESLKVTGGFKIKLPKTRTYSNSLDVNASGDKLCISVADTNKAVLWDLNKKKPLHTLGWHKGEIESVVFDENNHYVMTAGMDGRSYIWNIETGKMVGALPPHADYVISGGFSKNGFWSATGSYDKSIHVINISSMKLAYKLRAHSSAVTKLKFISKFRLLSGDKVGDIVIWDYSRGRLIKRLPRLSDHVVDFEVDEQEKYLFACTKDKKIALYDLETYEMVTDAYINLSSITTSLHYIKETQTLIIGTVDGILTLYDILSDEKELQKHIDDKKYDLAYELIQTNPLLERSGYYEKLEQIWETTVQKTKILLEKGQIDVVKQIFAPFMIVPAKRIVIQALLNDFVEFEKFKTLVSKKKYPLAYSMSNQFPNFKQTKYYQHMEDNWRKVFDEARRVIFDRNKEDYVKQILNPFRGVSEKTALIQSLFSEKEIYQILKTKLAKREFKEFFSLIDRYPYLTELEEYEKAVQFSKNLEIQANQQLLEGNFGKAVAFARMLEDFPNSDTFAKETIKKAQTMANFIRLIADKSYNKVYKYVKDEPFLEDIEDFKILEEKWLSTLKKAELSAANGNVEEILELMKNFMKIEEKLPKIGETVKSAYLYQILEYLKTGKLRKATLEKAFMSYVSIFGFDAEVMDLIDRAKKKYALSFEEVAEGQKSKWYFQTLPPQIIESA